jgi:hypothetical protein
LALAAFLVSGLALTTAACGGDDGGGKENKVASGGGKAEDNKAAGGQTDAKPGGDTNEQMVKYAGCMRENGIDMPDPKGGGAVAMMPAMPMGGDMSKTENAIKACERFLPKSEYDMDDPAYKEWQAKRTECLRAEGLDMGDGSSSTMTVDEETSKRAMAACDKKVPPYEKKK